MISDIILALSYWILGVLFALCAFCALGCMVGLFLSVLSSFKSPMRAVSVPLWAIFSFASLGGCWLLEWIYSSIGNRTDHAMHDWFLVGIVIPGILGFALVPRLASLAGKRTSGK